jgi:hypothetical protein
VTQVEALAKYAARASFADLSARSRQQLPVHILDSLGCCIAALGAGPVEACIFPGSPPLQIFCSLAAYELGEKSIKLRWT